MSCPQASSRSATSDCSPTATDVRRWPYRGFIYAPRLQISARCYPNSRSLHSIDPVPSANAAPCTSSHVIRLANRSARAQRFTARLPILPEDMMLPCMSTRPRTATDPQPALAHPMPRIGSTHSNTAIRPPNLVRNYIANQDRHTSIRLPSCPVDHLDSPQALFNPHTSTALAAYCKSPYPQRSAPASPTTNSSSRSAVDTALEIFIFAERCRYGTRDFAPVTSSLHATESYTGTRLDERDRLVCTCRKTNGDSPKLARRRPPLKGSIPTGHLRRYCTSIAETIASPLVGLNSRITMPSLAFTSKCV